MLLFYCEGKLRRTGYVRYLVSPRDLLPALSRYVPERRGINESSNLSEVIYVFDEYLLRGVHGHVDDTVHGVDVLAPVNELQHDVRQHWELSGDSHSDNMYANRDVAVMLSSALSCPDRFAQSSNFVNNSNKLETSWNQVNEHTLFTVKQSCF